MINPFQYGGLVGSDAFCNREQEMRDLRRSIENAERTFVYAERRLGKTSLVKRVLDALPQRQYIKVYVDLWPTDGTSSFVTTLASALTEATATTTGKLLETAKNLFQHLSPSLTLDESGSPSIQFGARHGMERGPVLQEVLAAPAKIAEKESRRVVIVLDEFQRLLEYDDDLVERSLRSAVQKQEGIAYLFLGSRKHLIQSMFQDTRRPLYRSAGHYPLGSIAVEHWIPFISERFEKGKRAISRELILDLCNLSEGHPFYTQHLAHALWERTPEGAAATEEGLRMSVDLLLQRESYAFTTLWESLAKNPQRFLTGLALEPSGVQPFSSSFVQGYGLRAPSNAQRAAETLMDRDIIDRSNGSYAITDRFFKLWIQRMR